MYVDIGDVPWTEAVRLWTAMIKHRSSIKLLTRKRRLCPRQIIHWEHSYGEYHFMEDEDRAKRNAMESLRCCGTDNALQVAVPYHRLLAMLPSIPVTVILFPDFRNGFVLGQRYTQTLLFTGHRLFTSHVSLLRRYHGLLICPTMCAIILSSLWIKDGYGTVIWAPHWNFHWKERTLYHVLIDYRDRLCSVVVRVPGYRSRGPGFDYRRYQIFWESVSLKRGQLKTREDNLRATWKK
jgi:hypothetical protein